MSIQRQSEYYDDIYKRSDEYRLPYSESTYLTLWNKILPLIPTAIHICELGCGVGQFAQMLFDNKFRHYTGHDFSHKAIQMAKLKAIKGYQFHVTDLTTHVFSEDDNIFIALELLEHTRDFKIIENIGLGKTLIFSVPDFNDPGHVRYFHSVNEVVDRYKNVILFDYIEKISGWYLCRGTTI